MKRALLTGGTGFVGSNIIDILSKDYELLAPTRQELNLLSEECVRDYLETYNVDVVFHCANPNPVKNTLDSNVNMTEGSLKIFLNILNCKETFEKMIFLGSGAMYDKTKDIINISEDECFRSIPEDSYGFAKYIEGKLAEKEHKIINLCLFACYGPGDHESKFITHCIRCCMDNSPITIRKNCKFDYIHVYDLGRILSEMGRKELLGNMYNLSGGEHVYLSDIAKIVKDEMDSSSEIIILEPGMNREYTANGNVLIHELGIKPEINMREGIKMQIKWELNNR